MISRNHYRCNDVYKRRDSIVILLFWQKSWRWARSLSGHVETIGRRDGSDCSYVRDGGAEGDRPAVSKAHRRAVEQGQCFHHCRSFFHSLCQKWTVLSLSLSLLFTLFLAVKDPLSSSCRWVPSAGRYQCLYAAKVGEWIGFVKVPSSFPLSLALYASSSLRYLHPLGTTFKNDFFSPTWPRLIWIFSNKIT